MLTSCLLDQNHFILSGSTWEETIQHKTTMGGVNKVFKELSGEKLTLNISKSAFSGLTKL